VIQAGRQSAFLAFKRVGANLGFRQFLPPSVVARRGQTTCLPLASPLACVPSPRRFPTGRVGWKSLWCAPVCRKCHSARLFPVSRCPQSTSRNPLPFVVASTRMVVVGKFILLFVLQQPQPQGEQLGYQGDHVAQWYVGLPFSFFLSFFSFWLFACDGTFA
jgi:hypothetical protein